MSKAYKPFTYEDSTSLYYIEIIKAKQFEYQIRLWSNYPQLECYHKTLHGKDILRYILQKYTNVRQGIQTQVNTVKNSTLANINQLFESALQDKNYAVIPSRGILKLSMGQANFLQIYTGKSSSLPSTLQLQFQFQKNKLAKQQNMRTYITKQLKNVYKGIDDIKNNNKVKIGQQNKQEEDAQPQADDKFEHSADLNNNSQHKKTIEEINNIFQDINNHAIEITKLQQKIKAQIKKIKENSLSDRKNLRLKEVNNQFKRKSNNSEAYEDEKMESTPKKYRDLIERRDEEEDGEAAHGRKRVNVEVNREENEFGGNFDSGDSFDQNLNMNMTNKINLYRTPNYESQAKKISNKGQKKRPLEVSKSKSYAINTSTLKFILNPFSNPAYFKVQGTLIQKIQHSTGPENDKGLILDQEITLEHDEKKTIKFRIAKHENTEDQQNSGIYLGVIIKTYAVNYPDEDKVNLYSSFGELHSDGQSSSQGNGFSQGSIIEIIISKSRIEWVVNNQQSAAIQKNIKRICTYYPILVIRKINDVVEYLGES